MTPILLSCGPVGTARRLTLSLITLTSAAMLLSACGSSPIATSSGLPTSSATARTGQTSAPAGNSAWSAPVKVDSLDTAGLIAVSCVSSSFCAAVDPMGNVFIDSSGTWSSATNIDSAIVNGNTGEDSLQTISCASTTFCVAGDARSNVMVYNGTTWSPPQLVDSNAGGASFFAVSCPTTTFCVAVDGASNAATYNGTTWSAAQPVDANGTVLSSELTGVSCASTTFCVAVDGADHSIVYNGSSWGQVQTLNTAGGQQPVVPYVSCASATLCVGAGSINDTSEYLVTYDGSSWSTPVPAKDTPDEYIAVSCTSGPFCMVLEQGGKMVNYDGSNWAAPKQIEPLTEAALPNGVSCASASFCVAIDSAGNALISTP